jgi:hypothetical protein
MKRKYFMRRMALGLLFSLALAAPALAANTDATVFPPDATTCPLNQIALISTKQIGDRQFTSTVCMTPTQVLSDAWPCGAAQTLVKNADGSLACQAISANLPSVTCPSGQAVTSIVNGVPTCSAISGGGALASCRLDTYQQVGPGWVNIYYVHVQPNGSDILPYGISWFQVRFGTIIPITFAQTQTKPTGWQDDQPGTCESGSRNDPDWTFSGSGTHCFSCINGNWSENSFYPPAQPAPIPPSSS